MFRLEPRYRETHEILRKDWSRCLEPGEVDAVDQSFALRDETVPLSEDFGYSLASALTVRAIANLAGHRVMLHAAGLADDAGRVVALVAPSGSGKTTAARTLARLGFGYVTDETVAVDRDGSVLPYPKPLSVIEDPDHPNQKRQHGPDALRLALAPESLVLTRLVLLDRVRDRQVEPTLTAVPLLDALMELLPQTSALSKVETPLQRLCGLVGRCGTHRLTYSDAEDTATVLRALLEEPVGTAADWEPLAQQPAPAVGPASTPAATLPASRTPLYTRGPVSDAVRIHDEALVLVRRVPVRLGPLGLTIWERCGSGATEADLVRAAVEKHGHHPDAGPAVHDALEGMVAAEVLTRS